MAEDDCIPFGSVKLAFRMVSFREIYCMPHCTTQSCQMSLFHPRLMHSFWHGALMKTWNQVCHIFIVCLLWTLCSLNIFGLASPVVNIGRNNEFFFVDAPSLTHDRILRYFFVLPQQSNNLIRLLLSTNLLHLQFLFIRCFCFVLCRIVLYETKFDVFLLISGCF